MAERWEPDQNRKAGPAAPASAEVRTADGRTALLVSREVVKPGRPVEHTVEALAAINSKAGKTRKVNYIPYDPFGVPNRQMDHTALIAVFTHNGRLFFSVPDGVVHGRGRRVFLIEREMDEQQGSISIKGGDSNQSLSFSSRNPLQHYLSTITAGELEVAQKLLEPWMHLPEDVATPIEGDEGSSDEAVVTGRETTRRELSRSMAFILAEDLTPVEDEPPEHIVNLADLARPVPNLARKESVPAVAAPKVSSTLQIQTVPDSMTADMIAGTTVIEPNQEVPIPLSPLEYEEFALFETPREGTSPRDFLRMMVFEGNVIVSVFEDGEWGVYRYLNKDGMWKAPGRGAGYDLRLHKIGAHDDNVSVSAIRNPVILAHLKPGSTGLDRERLKASTTAAERNAVFQAHLEKVRAGRLQPRSGHGDVLAVALPSGLTSRNTVIPKPWEDTPEQEATPSLTRTRIALAVGAALGFAAVATAGAVILKSCTDDAPQGEVSGATVPDED